MSGPGDFLAILFAVFMTCFVAAWMTILPRTLTDTFTVLSLATVVLAIARQRDNPEPEYVADAAVPEQQGAVR